MRIDLKQVFVTNQLMGTSHKGRKKRHQAWWRFVKVKLTAN